MEEFLGLEYDKIQLDMLYIMQDKAIFDINIKVSARLWSSEILNFGSGSIFVGVKV